MWQTDVKYIMCYVDLLDKECATNKQSTRF